MTEDPFVTSVLEMESISGSPNACSSSINVASIAVITGDKPDDRYITLGTGNGDFQRWKLTEVLARKIRRELNQRLD